MAQGASSTRDSSHDEEPYAQLCQRVSDLESRGAEAKKAADTLKARVTLLEGSLRLLQCESVPQLLAIADYICNHIHA